MELRGILSVREKVVRRRAVGGGGGSRGIHGGVSRTPGSNLDKSHEILEKSTEPFVVVG